MCEEATTRVLAPAGRSELRLRSIVSGRRSRPRDLRGASLKQRDEVALFRGQSRARSPHCESCDRARRCRDRHGEGAASLIGTAVQRIAAFNDG